LAAPAPRLLPLSRLLPLTLAVAGCGGSSSGLGERVSPLRASTLGEVGVDEEQTPSQYSLNNKVSAL